jgi:segregation and condensation protein A
MQTQRWKSTGRWYGSGRMPEDMFHDETGPAVEQRLASEALTVDVDGYEGPLDLLLMLARTQKVDLRRVSILQLAEQYLTFVEAARKLRIELAADYLVMAAWLAYLKSRLLLPPDPSDEGPSGEDLAAHLAFQLERLEAMRRVAAQLMGRDQLGREFFARGEPQAVTRKRRIEHTATLLDLMQAYSRIRTRDDFRPLNMRRDATYSLEQALERMTGLIGHAIDWGLLSQYLPDEFRCNPKLRRSAIASTFAASLELVKAGRAEIRQEGSFAPLYLRKAGGARA